jgi:hypothetical protein
VLQRACAANVFDASVVVDGDERVSAEDIVSFSF